MPATTLLAAKLHLTPCSTLCLGRCVHAPRYVKGSRNPDLTGVPGVHPTSSGCLLLLQFRLSSCHIVCLCAVVNQHAEVYAPECASACLVHTVLLLRGVERWWRGGGLLPGGLLLQCFVVHKDIPTMCCCVSGLHRVACTQPIAGATDLLTPCLLR